MGVPKFFRWVSSRFPGILASSSDANYSVEVDNLYLDMNGIIHTCSHGNGIFSVFDSKLEDIFERIFTHIEILVNFIRPRKLIYIAVDGIAPRAKLNQQRSRRFRSAKEAEFSLLSDVKNEAYFDSNCITPGTYFMHQLDQRLKAFIETHFNSAAVENSSWKNLDIHFSGSSVPGEGEHKIVSFIRNWRTSDQYSTNTRHCIYGADADMIMLALATHEPFFLVLRDVPKSAHHTKRGNASSTEASNTPLIDIKNMVFIRINILREYLVNDLLEDMPPLDMQIDFERLIDDFVFLTFLVGNDFLPHLPAIDIGDGAFDIIFEAYKTVLASLTGGLDYDDENTQDMDESLLPDVNNFYLIEAGKVDAKKLEMMFSIMSATELSLYQDSEVMKEIVRGKKQRQLQGTAYEGQEPTSEEEYKRRYYKSKFNIDILSEDGKKELENIRQSYFVGLCWCLSYYSQGCVSWSWFYPYHFGPFLQDMVGLEAIANQLVFSLDSPLSPFQQLLACLPSSSRFLLPECYHWLMSAEDSPLKEYYPLEFKSDLADKKKEWESVVILPFIDQQRLLEAEGAYCDRNSLSSSEKERNQFGQSFIFKIRTSSTGEAALEVLAKPPDFRPHRIPFEPYLPLGTSPTLPGFPSLSSVVIRTGKGKKDDSTDGRKATSRKSRLRRNREARSQIAALNADSQFPMLGDAARQNWASTSTSSSVPPFSTGNGHGPSVRIRFLLNDDANIFLFDMMEQMKLQVPQQLRHRDSSPMGCNGIYCVEYGLQTPAAVSSGDMDGIFAKVCDIFGSIRCRVVPVCSVEPTTGLVSIRFEDVSHLSQVEYFLSRKLSPFCNSERVISDREVVNSVRNVVIGLYVGTEAAAFENRLNSEVSSISQHLPLFVSRVVEVVLSTNLQEDEHPNGSQVKQYVLCGTESSGSSSSFGSSVGVKQGSISMS